MLPDKILFNGRVVGNVLRKDYGPAAQISNVPPRDIEVSQIEIEMPNSGFGLSFTQVEVRGYYPIGKTVQVVINLA